MNSLIFAALLTVAGPTDSIYLDSNLDFRIINININHNRLVIRRPPPTPTPIPCTLALFLSALLILINRRIK